MLIISLGVMIGFKNVEFNKMRLTQNQKKVILENTQQYFGTNSTIWLFGSRVDDSKKGGDIDLYVETYLNDSEIIPAKMKFLSSLYNAFGEQKIDLVLHQMQKNIVYPIYEHARTTGAKLCP